MERNPSTRSLLIDYSKHRARPEELKEADALLPNTIHVSSVVSKPGFQGNHSRTYFNDSVSSFGPPELNPMMNGSSSQLLCYLPGSAGAAGSGTRDSLKAQRMLGASADTIEMEGDDSFACDKPLDDLLSPVRSPRATRAAPRNRRLGNRRTHSLSQLRELGLTDESSDHHQQPDEDNDDQEQESLRFSLRRRPSQTNRNDKTKAPLGRSKTWDPSAQNQPDDDDIIPGRSWGAILDASQHSEAATAKPKQITPENRRRMLVRHSSVSALEQSSRPFGGFFASMDMSMPAVVGGSPGTRRSGMARQSSLRGTLPRQSSLRGVMAAPRSPKRSDEPEKVLPDTIEIKPKDPNKSTKKKKKQISLDNHFRRHSSHNDNNNNKKSSGTTSIASRSAFTTALGRTSLHSIGDAMSVSEKSHFTTGHRCPSTRSKNTPSRQLNMSNGSNLNRRDLLRRSLSSRRHLKGDNTATTMEDTSHFVTGSRIRRCSGRELLGC